jgi:hypothetical protein
LSKSCGEADEKDPPPTSCGEADEKDPPPTSASLHSITMSDESFAWHFTKMLSLMGILLKEVLTNEETGKWKQFQFDSLTQYIRTW